MSEMWSLLVSVVSVLVLERSGMSVARGVFQLHVRCVHAEVCWPVAVVCVTVQREASMSGPCHFGRREVSLLDEGEEGVVIFDVRGRPPARFSLLLEMGGGERRRTIVTRVESSAGTWSSVEVVSGSVRLLVRHRFRCSATFYGADCARRCQPRDDVHGHYECSASGHRVCHVGWSGAFCTVAAVSRCGAGCPSGRCDEAVGRCDSSRCQVGWEGARCERCRAAADCLHGRCAVDAHGLALPGTCRCLSGWGGQRCHLNLAWCSHHPRVCLNGATCVNQLQNGRPFLCRCLPGFSGRFCQHADRSHIRATPSPKALPIGVIAAALVLALLSVAVAVGVFALVRHQCRPHRTSSPPITVLHNDLRAANEQQKVGFDPTAL